MIGQSARGTDQLAGLKARLQDLQVKTSDIQVHIGQLREQQTLAGPSDMLRFQKPLADAQHEFTVGMVEYEATRAQIRQLEGGQSVTVQPPTDALFGRKQLDATGIGIFFLMIPIVLAFARRIWVRSGTAAQATFDLDSSPRLQRLEQAVESIAIEVERIGEAQRFSTKLLVERRPESVPVANARREPGTITPH